MRVLIVGAAVLALAAGGVSARPAGYEADTGTSGTSVPSDLGHSAHAVDPAADAIKTLRTHEPIAKIEAVPESGTERSRNVGLNRDFRRAMEADDRDEGGSAWSWSFAQRDRERDVIAGCPPRLTGKGNRCNAPGQASDRDALGYVYQPSLFGLTHYDNGRYFYDNGYLVRLANEGTIDGYIPLFGGALAVGNRWPESYPGYAVPGYYEDYYNLGGSDRYRYADNVIYRVDPGDGSITSIAAMLTGTEFNVGQPMPPGYDVYNVPEVYRGRYYDTADAWYRYSDGYVYQIDPQTRLVAAVISLLI